MGDAAEADQKPEKMERPLIQSPWLSLIVFPLCTTLVGVLAALWLNNLISARAEYRKTLAVLDVTIQECAANNSRLAMLTISDGDPPFLPSLGIAAVSLHRDAALLSALNADDFTSLIRQLAAVNEAYARYGMFANQLTTLPRPTDLPPPMVAPGGVSQLEIARTAHVRRLEVALSAFKNAFLAFCDTARSVRTKHWD